MRGGAEGRAAIPSARSAKCSDTRPSGQHPRCPIYDKSYADNKAEKKRLSETPPFFCNQLDGMMPVLDKGTMPVLD